MFSRFFGDRYFAARFWPNTGDVIVVVTPTAYVRVDVGPRRKRFEVPPERTRLFPPSKRKLVR